MTFRSRVRLVDEVAQELRQRIYSGAYALGAPLRQEQLAEELEISRTPLREAIRVLENEGLLQSAPNRTVRVVSASIEKVLAAYQMREVLDGLAARLAASVPDDEARQLPARIAEQQPALLQPWDKPGYSQSNVDFHAAIFELAGNEYLTAQLPLLHMSSQVFAPVGVLADDHAAIAVFQHRATATAIASGDAERAEHLAREHIRTTMAGIAAYDAARAGSAP